MDADNQRLDPRAEEILRLVIDQHVATNRPVGSGTVARATRAGWSPATIRHLMAMLESDGYLYQPHTSAGRVPTKTGYRYYVDVLGTRSSLDPHEEVLVRSTLAPMRDDLRGLFDGTSRLLSRLSRQFGVVHWVADRRIDPDLFVEGAEAALEQPEFRDASVMRSLFLTLQRRDTLANILGRCMENRGLQVHIGAKDFAPDLDDFTLVVASYGPRDRPLGSLGILGPIRMRYDRVMAVVECVSRTCSGLLTGPTH